MSEMLIIVKREFMERVHTRSFLVGTILFPVFMIEIALTVWIAGKIYRVGILSTGKKPTLKELGRWMRMA